MIASQILGLSLKKCQKYISCESALHEINKNSNTNNSKISFLDRNHDLKVTSIEIKNLLITLAKNTEYLHELINLKYIIFIFTLHNKLNQLKKYLEENKNCKIFLKVRQIIRSDIKLQKSNLRSKLNSHQIYRV